jgi:hypothetical protein
MKQICIGAEHNGKETDTKPYQLMNYNYLRRWLAALQQTLSALEQESTYEPDEHTRVVEQYRSSIAELQAKLREYEALDKPSQPIESEPTVAAVAAA